MSPELSHIDEHGRAVMVDVTAKPQTLRRAEARSRVVGAGALALSALSRRGEPDVLTSARMAGLEAAKATSNLIPLCHPLPLSGIVVEFHPAADSLEVRAFTETVGQTGVEMEALAACAVASLTVVAALGPANPAIHVEGLCLWEKAGGRSGHYQRVLAASSDEEEAP